MQAREAGPITTTSALADIVQRAIPGKPGDIHPATRTFQALRIAVNDELGELVRALAGSEEILAEGGALAVVTFHSLEDRIVKQFFAQRSGRGEARSRLLPGEPIPPPSTFTLQTRQAIAPSRDGDGRQSARALREAARRAAHRCAGARARYAARSAGGSARARYAQRGEAQMIRFLNIVAAAALVGSAVYAYSIKYQTIYRSDQIAKLTRQIQQERDGLNMQRAEWEHLTRPDRIAPLADKYLTDLEMTRPTQMVTFAQLPDRAARGDEIGKKLEALGLAEPTNTPSATRPPAPATPTAPAARKR